MRCQPQRTQLLSSQSTSCLRLQGQLGPGRSSSSPAGVPQLSAPIQPCPVGKAAPRSPELHPRSRWLSFPRVPAGGTGGHGLWGRDSVRVPAPLPTPSPFLAPMPVGPGGRGCHLAGPCEDSARKHTLTLMTVTFPSVPSPPATGGHVSLSSLTLKQSPQPRLRGSVATRG